jgi:hypothetical protein
MAVPAPAEGGDADHILRDQDREEDGGAADRIDAERDQRRGEGAEAGEAALRQAEQDHRRDREEVEMERERHRHSPYHRSS